MKQFLFFLVSITILIYSTATDVIGQQSRFKASVLAGVNLTQLDGDMLAGFHQIGFNGGGALCLNPKSDNTCLDDAVCG